MKRFLEKSVSYTARHLIFFISAVLLLAAFVYGCGGSGGSG
ncbi:MAG: hypothetical protein ACD_47C00161G0002, partial [uncultured bacterium]